MGQAVSPEVPQKMKPSLSLKEDELGGFENLTPGDPIRLEIVGKVLSKSIPENPGSKDEYTSKGDVRIQIHSVEVLGKISDKQAEKMSDEDLDTEIEKEMDAKNKVSEPDDKNE